MKAIKKILLIVSNLSKQITQNARYLLLYFLLADLGKGVKIYGWPRIYYPENIKIGDHSTINHGVLIDGRGGVIIGNNVRISPYVIIETSFLEGSDIPKKHGAKNITIHDGVWIASGAIILAGVTIGENAVVAAGAVVTKDVPADSMVKGIPARA